MRVGHRVRERHGIDGRHAGGARRGDNRGPRPVGHRVPVRDGGQAQVRRIVREPQDEGAQTWDGAAHDRAQLCHAPSRLHQHGQPDPPGLEMQRSLDVVERGHHPIDFLGVLDLWKDDAIQGIGARVTRASRVVEDRHEVLGRGRQVEAAGAIELQRRRTIDPAPIGLAQHAHGSLAATFGDVGPQGLRVLTIQHHERRAPGLSQRSAHGGGRQLQALCQQLGRDLKTRQQAAHRTCPRLNRLPGRRLIRGRRRKVGLLPPVAQG